MSQQIKSKLREGNALSCVALGMAFVFFVTSLGTPLPVAHAQVIPQTHLEKLDVTNLLVPEKIGKVVESFQGQVGPTVILVQDAHAIPDAQKNIHNLIKFFQNKYGIRLVGLEGSEGPLDAQFLNSFPDKKILKEVFKEYYKQGEMTGGNGAVLFDGDASAYWGIEDWDLYEEGIALYQQAYFQREAIAAVVRPIAAEIKNKKTEIYSKNLLALDQASEKFYDHFGGMLELVQALAEIKKPVAGSELDAMLQEANRDKRGDTESLYLEAKKLAQGAENFLAQTGDKEDFKKFQAKKQEFETGQIQAEHYVKFIQEIMAGHGLQPKLSGALAGLVKKEQKLADIEGTKFFDEFKSYIDDVMLFAIQQDLGNSANKDQARELYRQTQDLRVIEKLSKLEVSTDEYTALKNNAFFKPETFKAQVAFYENAKKRDQTLYRNLIKKHQEMDGSAADANLMLIAGGFHTHGITKLLEEANTSYVLLMPSIQKIPEKSVYEQQMLGDVAWKSYFKVVNGKVNLHEAFARAARDKLISGDSSGVAGGIPRGGAAGTNDSLSSEDLRLLKSWRDQIIRDLSKQGRVEESGKYTRFIDEKMEKTTDQRLKTTDNKVQWARNINRFIKGLLKLEKENNITQQNIANLLKPSFVPPTVIAGVFSNQSATAEGVTPSATRLSITQTLGASARNTNEEGRREWLKKMLLGLGSGRNFDLGDIEMAMEFLTGADSLAPPAWLAGIVKSFAIDSAHYHIEDTLRDSDSERILQAGDINVLSQLLEESSLEDMIGDWATFKGNLFEVLRLAEADSASRLNPLLGLDNEMSALGARIAQKESVARVVLDNFPKMAGSDFERRLTSVVEQYLGFSPEQLSEKIANAKPSSWAEMHDVTLRAGAQKNEMAKLAYLDKKLVKLNLELAQAAAYFQRKFEATNFISDEALEKKYFDLITQYARYADLKKKSEATVSKNRSESRQSDAEPKKPNEDRLIEFKTFELGAVGFEVNKAWSDAGKTDEEKILEFAEMLGSHGVSADMQMMIFIMMNSYLNYLLDDVYKVGSLERSPKNIKSIGIQYNAQDPGRSKITIDYQTPLIEGALVHSSTGEANSILLGDLNQNFSLAEVFKHLKGEQIDEEIRIFASDDNKVLSWKRAFFALLAKTYPERVKVGSAGDVSNPKYYIGFSYEYDPVSGARPANAGASAAGADSNIKVLKSILRLYPKDFPHQDFEAALSERLAAMEKVHKVLDIMVSELLALKLAMPSDKGLSKFFYSLDSPNRAIRFYRQQRLELEFMRARSLSPTKGVGVAHAKAIDASMYVLISDIIKDLDAAKEHFSNTANRKIGEQAIAGSAKQLGLDNDLSISELLGLIDKIREENNQFASGAIGPDSWSEDEKSDKFREEFITEAANITFDTHGVSGKFKDYYLSKIPKKAWNKKLRPSDVFRIIKAHAIASKKKINDDEWGIGKKIDEIMLKNPTLLGLPEPPMSGDSLISLLKRNRSEARTLAVARTGGGVEDGKINSKTLDSLPPDLKVRMKRLIDSGRGLIKAESGNTVEAVDVVLTNYASDTLGKDKYIRLTLRDEIDLLRAKNDGRLLNIIRNGGLILIDYFDSDPSVVDKLNSLFEVETKPHLDGVLVHPETKIVAVFPADKYDSRSVSFRSRFKSDDFDLSFDDPTENIQTLKDIPDSDAAIVATIDFRKRIENSLVGKIGYKDGKTDPVSGPLIQALERAKKREEYSLFLRGVDLAESDLKHYLRQAVLKGYITFAGTDYDVPSDFLEHVFFYEYDYGKNVKGVKQIVRGEVGDVGSSQFTVNRELAHALFDTVTVVEGSNSLNDVAGLLAEAKQSNTPIRLRVTEDLTGEDYIWHAIMQSEANITIELVGDVSVPIEYTALVKTSSSDTKPRAPPSLENAMAQESGVVLIEGNQRELMEEEVRAAHPKRNVVTYDVSKTDSPSSIFRKINTQDEQFELSIQQVLTHLASGHVVILNGLETNPSFFGALESVLQHRPYIWSHGFVDLSKLPGKLVLVRERRGDEDEPYHDLAVQLKSDRKLLKGALKRVQTKNAHTDAEISELISGLELLDKALSSMPEPERVGEYPSEHQLGFPLMKTLMEYDRKDWYGVLERRLISHYTGSPNIEAFVRAMVKLHLRVDEPGMGPDEVHYGRFNQALNRAPDFGPWNNPSINFWLFAQSLGSNLLEKNLAGESFETKNTYRVERIIQDALIASYEAKAISESENITESEKQRAATAARMYRSRFNLENMKIEAKAEIAWLDVPKKNSDRKEVVDEIVGVLKTERAIFFRGVMAVGKTYLAKLLASEKRLGYTSNDKPVFVSLSPDTRVKDIEDKLESWAAGEGGILVADEANLVEHGFWDFLAGFFSDHPHIWIKGKRYPLSEKHRIVFTGNLETFEGRRFQDLLMRRVSAINLEPFDRGSYVAQTETYLPEKMKDRKKLAELMVDVHLMFSKMSPRDGLSLRDIQQLAISLVADSSDSWTIESVLAQAWLQYAGRLSGGQQIALDLIFYRKFDVKPSRLNVPAAYAYKQENEAQLRKAGFIPVNRGVATSFKITQFLKTLGKRKTYFGAMPDEARTLVQGKRAMLLEGASGEGKDQAVVATLNLQENGYLEATLEQPLNIGAKRFYRIVGSPDTEFLEEILDRATREGAIIVISEPNLIPSDWIEGRLNPVLDGARPDGQPVTDGFGVIGTMNDFQGRFSFSSAFLSRVVYERIVSYSEDEILQILGEKNLKGTPSKDVELLVRHHAWVKNQIKEVEKKPTMRELDRAMKLVESGMSVEEAIWQEYRMDYLVPTLHLTRPLTKKEISTLKIDKKSDIFDSFHAFVAFFLPAHIGPVEIRWMELAGEDTATWESGKGMTTNQIRLDPLLATIGAWDLLFTSLSHEAAHGGITRKFSGFKFKNDKGFDRYFQDLEDIRHGNFRLSFDPGIEDRESFKPAAARLKANPADFLLKQNPRDAFALIMTTLGGGWLNPEALNRFRKRAPVALALRVMDDVKKVYASIPASESEEDVLIASFEAHEAMQSAYDKLAGEHETLGRKKKGESDVPHLKISAGVADSAVEKSMNLDTGLLSDNEKPGKATKGPKKQSTVELPEGAVETVSQVPTRSVWEQVKGFLVKIKTLWSQVNRTVSAAKLLIRDVLGSKALKWVSILVLMPAAAWMGYQINWTNLFSFIKETLESMDFGGGLDSGGNSTPAAPSVGIEQVTDPAMTGQSTVAGEASTPQVKSSESGSGVNLFRDIFKLVMGTGAFLLVLWAILKIQAVKNFLNVSGIKFDNTNGSAHQDSDAKQKRIDRAQEYHVGGQGFAASAKLREESLQNNIVVKRQEYTTRLTERIESKLKGELNRLLRTGTKPGKVVGDYGEFSADLLGVNGNNMEQAYLRPGGIAIRNKRLVITADELSRTVDNNELLSEVIFFLIDQGIEVIVVTSDETFVKTSSPTVLFNALKAQKPIRNQNQVVAQLKQKFGSGIAVSSLQEISDRFVPYYAHELISGASAEEMNNSKDKTYDLHVADKVQQLSLPIGHFVQPTQYYNSFKMATSDGNPLPLSPALHEEAITLYNFLVKEFERMGRGVPKMSELIKLRRYSTGEERIELSFPEAYGYIKLSLNEFPPLRFLHQLDFFNIKITDLPVNALSPGNFPALEKIIFKSESVSRKDGLRWLKAWREKHPDTIKHFPPKSLVGVGRTDLTLTTLTETETKTNFNNPEVRRLRYEQFETFRDVVTQVMKTMGGTVEQSEERVVNGEYDGIYKIKTGDGNVVGTLRTSGVEVDLGLDFKSPADFSSFFDAMASNEELDRLLDSGFAVQFLWLQDENIKQLTQTQGEGVYAYHPIFEKLNVERILMAGTWYKQISDFTKKWENLELAESIEIQELDGHVKQNLRSIIDQTRGRTQEVVQEEKYNEKRAAFKRPEDYSWQDRSKIIQTIRPSYDYEKLLVQLEALKTLLDEPGRYKHVIIKRDENGKFPDDTEDYLNNYDHTSIAKYMDAILVRVVTAEDGSRVHRESRLIYGITNDDNVRSIELTSQMGFQPKYKLSAFQSILRDTPAIGHIDLSYVDNSEVSQFINSAKNSGVTLWLSYGQIQHLYNDMEGTEREKEEKIEALFTGIKEIYIEHNSKAPSEPGMDWTFLRLLPIYNLAMWLGKDRIPYSLFRHFPLYRRSLMDVANEDWLRELAGVHPDWRMGEDSGLRVEGRVGRETLKRRIGISEEDLGALERKNLQDSYLTPVRILNPERARLIALLRRQGGEQMWRNVGELFGRENSFGKFKRLVQPLRSGSLAIEGAVKGLGKDNKDSARLAVQRSEARGDRLTADFKPANKFGSVVDPTKAVFENLYGYDYSVSTFHIPSGDDHIRLLNVAQQAAKMNGKKPDEKPVIVSVDAGTGFFEYLLAMKRPGHRKGLVHPRVIAIEPYGALAAEVAKTFNLERKDVEVAINGVMHNVVMYTASDPDQLDLTYIVASADEAADVLNALPGIEIAPKSDETQQKEEQLSKAYEDYSKELKALDHSRKGGRLMRRMSQADKEAEYANRTQLIELVKEKFENIVSREKELEDLYGKRKSNIDMVLSSWMPLGVDFSKPLKSINAQALVHIYQGATAISEYEQEFTSDTINYDTYSRGTDQLLPMPSLKLAAQEVFKPTVSPDLTTEGYKQVDYWGGIGAGSRDNIAVFMRQTEPGVGFSSEKKGYDPVSGLIAKKGELFHWQFQKFWERAVRSYVNNSGLAPFKEGEFEGYDYNPSEAEAIGAVTQKREPPSHENRIEQREGRDGLTRSEVRAAAIVVINSVNPTNGDTATEDEVLSIYTVAKKDVSAVIDAVKQLAIDQGIKLDVEEGKDSVTQATDFSADLLGAMFTKAAGVDDTVTLAVRGAKESLVKQLFESLKNRGAVFQVVTDSENYRVAKALVDDSVGARKAVNAEWTTGITVLRGNYQTKVPVADGQETELNEMFLPLINGATKRERGENQNQDFADDLLYSSFLIAIAMITSTKQFAVDVEAVFSKGGKSKLQAEADVILTHLEKYNDALGLANGALRRILNFEDGAFTFNGEIIMQILADQAVSTSA